jgi:hypothetical protein
VCPRVGTGVPAVTAPPRRLRDVSPALGVRGRVGRTVGAVGVSVDDLVFSLSPAFLAYSGGGLRGGSYAVRRGRVVLRRFEAVSGVRLTGFAVGGTLRLRVSGPAAAPGRVRVSASGRVRGRLGGRRVDTRIARATTARSSAASAASPHISLLRASLVTKPAHPRLVPSPAR